MVLQSHREAVRAQLTEVNRQHKLVFSLLCGERLRAFLAVINKKGWTDRSRCVSDCLDRLWDSAQRSSPTDETIANMLAQLETVLPEWDDFNNIWESQVASAMSCAWSCVQLLREDDVQHCVDSATSAIECASLYVFSQFEPAANNWTLDQRLSQEVPQRELTKQQADIAFLCGPNILNADELARRRSDNCQWSIPLARDYVE